MTYTKNIFDFQNFPASFKDQDNGKFIRLEKGDIERFIQSIIELYSNSEGENSSLYQTIFLAIQWILHKALEDKEYVKFIAEIKYKHITKKSKAYLYIKSLVNNLNNYIYFIIEAMKFTEIFNQIFRLFRTLLTEPKYALTHLNLFNKSLIYFQLRLEELIYPREIYSVLCTFKRGIINVVMKENARTMDIRKIASNYRSECLDFDYYSKFSPDNIIPRKGSEKDEHITGFGIFIGDDIKESPIFYDLISHKLISLHISEFVYPLKIDSLNFAPYLIPIKKDLEYIDLASLNVIASYKILFKVCEHLSKYYFIKIRENSSILEYAPFKKYIVANNIDKLKNKIGDSGIKHLEKILDSFDLHSAESEGLFSYLNFKGGMTIEK